MNETQLKLIAETSPKLYLILRMYWAGGITWDETLRYSLIVLAERAMEIAAELEAEK